MGADNLCNCELRDRAAGKHRSACKLCNIVWLRRHISTFMLLFSIMFFMFSPCSSIFEGISFVMMVVFVNLYCHFDHEKRFPCEKAKDRFCDYVVTHCDYCATDVNRKQAKMFFTFFGCRSIAKSYSKKK